MSGDTSATIQVLVFTAHDWISKNICADNALKVLTDSLFESILFKTILVSRFMICRHSLVQPTGNRREHRLSDFLNMPFPFSSDDEIAATWL
jgi:hypothetical protein